MAELPFTDESARELLKLFAELHLRPGEQVIWWHLEQRFFDNPKFRVEDYAAGLSYAIDRAIAVLPSRLDGSRKIGSGAYLPVPD